MSERNPENDEIAEKAYQLYRERGGEDGKALDDWLQAEAEVRERELGTPTEEAQTEPPALDEGPHAGEEEGAGMAPEGPRDQQLSME